ncbi:ribonuclease P protein component [Sulfurirhabdus autotrophica]|uniref:ribonuclease P protein component n=1 Tax=Sulfurirhabdus autotrophica TaxID=1706046 RepID=UPI000F613E4E|nr:ribonuclease P protein component [Sulfurirhabdus autotrophica]
MPSCKRLHKTDEFSSVFNFRCSVGNHFFQVFARPNQLAYPRLGLIVSRKISKRAVDRNYIKRTIREFFRLNQQQFGSLDVVVRTKKLFDRSSHTEIHQELLKLLGGLKKCHVSSSI